MKGAIKKESGRMKQEIKQEVDSNDSDSKKRRSNLPTESIAVLKRWLYLHRTHPYPNDFQKVNLANEASLTVHQVIDIFFNYQSIGY